MKHIRVGQVLRFYRLASFHVLSVSRPSMHGSEPASQACSHALPTMMDCVS